MTNLEKFKKVLEERLALASSPQTTSAYQILLNGFNGLFPTTKLYTSEEVKELCGRSFYAGQAYAQGSHKDFIQTHKNKETFINHLDI